MLSDFDIVWNGAVHVVVDASIAPAPVPEQTSRFVIVQKRCPTCGGEFPVQRARAPRRVYCSRRCRWPRGVGGR